MLGSAPAGPADQTDLWRVDSAYKACEGKDMYTASALRALGSASSSLRYETLGCKSPSLLYTRDMRDDLDALAMAPG